MTQEKEKKHPLEALVDFYKEGVETEDKKGFSELYKKATKLLFKRISKEIGMTLHYKDVEYLDGYFIFGYGTNSVVHFHVKEMPGWLCGIWWSPKEAKDHTEENPKYEKDVLSCNLFAQYESEIDKFKPSASMFGGKEFEFHFKEGYGDSAFLDSCYDFKFIIDEPELAFYKEMHYTDFNHEYVDKRKAKRFMKNHFELRKKQEEVKKINEEEMLKALAHIVGPMVKDGDLFIEDRGECWSPRYELWLKNIILEDGKPLADKEGCYHLMNLGEWPDKKADEKVWDKAEKECEKRSERVKDWFSNPCSLFVNIRDEKEFERVKALCIKEKSVITL